MASVHPPPSPPPHLPHTHAHPSPPPNPHPHPSLSFLSSLRHISSSNRPLHFADTLCVRYHDSCFTAQPLVYLMPNGSEVGWLVVGCLTSQQHASVSQGRICTDSLTCCHTEIEVADPTLYLTQSQYTDTGPTSPSTNPITPGAWQGNHWSANFQVTGMTRPLEKSRRKRDSNLGSSALEADALTTRPTRRSGSEDRSLGTGDKVTSSHSLSQARTTASKTDTVCLHCEALTAKLIGQVVTTDLHTGS